MRFRSPIGSRRWAPQLATALLFAALCATATYWALQLLAPPVAIAPSGSLVDWDKAPDLATASRLFGARPNAEQAAQAAVASSNILVVGIAAADSRGSAVLSIDGKPPRAYLAGERIDEHARLLAVRPDVVVIEQAGGRLELPTPDRPDISLLSSGPPRDMAGAAGTGAGGSGASAPGSAASGAGRTPRGAPGVVGSRTAPTFRGAAPSVPRYGSAAAPAVPPYGADAAPSKPAYGSDAQPQTDGQNLPPPDEGGNPEVSAAASEQASAPANVNSSGASIRRNPPRPGLAGRPAQQPASAPGGPQPRPPGVRSAVELAVALA
jgi:general secretion pathway protein C